MAIPDPVVVYYLRACHGYDREYLWHEFFVTANHKKIPKWLSFNLVKVYRNALFIIYHLQYVSALFAGNAESSFWFCIYRRNLRKSRFY